ncbi:MAG: histidine kinase [Chryseolinea sp.]
MSSHLFDKRITTNWPFVAFPSIIMILFTCLNCHAQRTKIDSLKHLLPTLSNQKQTDCLNLLSLAFSYLDGDTAESYQVRAYNEARSIHYERGELMALNNKAHIAGYVSRDFPLQENICRQIIHKYHGGRNIESLSETYLMLALSLFYQGMFDLSKVSCTTIISLSKETGNKQRLGEAIALLGSISFEIGDYQNAFESYNESLQIFDTIKDSYNTAIVLTEVGDLHRLAGDQTTAATLYYQSLKFKKGPSLIWHPLVDLGDTYYATIPMDALILDSDTLQTIKSLTINTNSIALDKIRQADKYLSESKYDKALVILKHELSISKKRKDLNYVMRLLLTTAKVYESKHDLTNSLNYTRQLLSIADKHRLKRYLQDGYQSMYKMYDKLNRSDSAYYYYQRYTEMKNVVALDGFGKSLAIYKAMVENDKARAQISIIKSAKQINDQKLKIREQELSRESIQKNILIGTVVALIIFGFVIARNNSLKRENDAQQRALIEQQLAVRTLESEKTERDMQQRALDLEMKALRAQMNPHFIFNSLNSINRFILQNNKNLASDYLTKFSKLIRIILYNSQYKSITLESELESLKLYLELERVRFNDHFAFIINIDKDIDTSVKLPPLILQPYVENAIWHGLMHKTDKGLLTIDISETDQLLNCQITDNGIGRKKSTEINKTSVSGHRSMGLGISSDRIALLHPDKEVFKYVITTDLTLPDGSSAGTEVCLKIPIRYD